MKDMFSYNHFKINKLKYVIVCIILMLILVLIRCYYNNKERFTNKEGFVNEMITDVLLGKKFDNKEENRINLSDNIKESGENQLNIIFSTYNIQPNTDNSDCVDNSDNDNPINIFLRTNVGTTTKILGDLFYKIKENKLGFRNNNHMILNNENVPHLLNPILNSDNALELTEMDIKINKKTKNEDIIERYFDYSGIKIDYTKLLINLIGIKDIKDIYFNDNMKKIYNYFTKGSTDVELLGKNDTQILNDLTYETNSNDDLFKIIKNVKYKEELQIYYDDIENKTSNISSQLSIILSNQLRNKIKTINEEGFSKRIYAGYNINSIDFIIPFKMNNNDKSVLINNSNKYQFKNNVLKKLKYNKPNHKDKIDILLNYYEIYIDEIILFKNTILETKILIPYLETDTTFQVNSNQNLIGPELIETDTTFQVNSNQNLIGPELIDINSNSLISNLQSFFIDLETMGKGESINNKIEKFKSDLTYILNNDNFFLNLPLRIIRMKNPDDTDNEDKEDKTHVIFGDIIDTYNIINTDNSILSNYVKIPRRCCFKTNQYYGDLNNQHLMCINDGTTTYNLYQHPIYKTFKVFTSEEIKDNENHGLKYIYEIEPCAPNISLYEKNIKAYNKLKDNCNNIKTSNNEHKIKDNSFNQLETQMKLNTINKNKTNLNNLRKQVVNLQNELDRKDIIKSNYNRVKLQKHNAHKQDQIYEAKRRLNKKDSLGINITYPQEVIDHLLTIYSNKNILNPEEQDKYNAIYSKLRQFDNESGNKDFNDFMDKKMKEDNIDIVRLLPDTNSQEFKNKYFNKILLSFLKSDNTNIE